MLESVPELVFELSSKPKFHLPLLCVYSADSFRHYSIPIFLNIRYMFVFAYLAGIQIYLRYKLVSALIVAFIPYYDTPYK